MNETAQEQLAARTATMDRILEAALEGNSLAWEAVRAGMVSPGAKVAFGGSMLPTRGAAAAVGPPVPKTLFDYQAERDKRFADTGAFRASQFPRDPYTGAASDAGRYDPFKQNYAGSAWMPGPAKLTW